MRFRFLCALYAAIALAVGCASPAAGQAFKPGASHTDQNPWPIYCKSWNGTSWVNESCGGTGGGGGGGGDASAANQTTQITAANLTNTRLGDITSPATGSVNNRLSQINTTLGTPFQAGGSIANTAFGISGTLPAFASTPTFNLGAPARATSTPGGGSVTTGGAYQSALAANPSRLDCLIQNTSTQTLRVFVGAPGSATDASAFQIAPGGTFGCGTGNGFTLTDQISVSAANAGATYVVVSQG